MFRDGSVRIEVPATSANLGPGFDSLGLALDLRDVLEAEVTPEGLRIDVEGAGAQSVPRDETHLVVRAMRLGFEALEVSPTGLRLTCHNVIPHARGLGSSSAAIVGGLALARALVIDGEQRLADDALFDLAADLEGHPDNVAPAVYGGFVVAGRAGRGVVEGHATTWFAAAAAVHPGVRGEVFIPSQGVETTVARGLLPSTVPHHDAAANAGRAALLVAALAADPDHLWEATRDFLHQEFRRPAMPESLALVDDLREAGHAAVISGAGPTVLVLRPDGDGADLSDRCPAGWRHRVLGIAQHGVRVATER